MESFCFVKSEFSESEGILLFIGFSFLSSFLFSIIFSLGVIDFCVSVNDFKELFFSIISVKLLTLDSSEFEVSVKGDIKLHPSKISFFLVILELNHLDIFGKDLKELQFLNILLKSLTLDTFQFDISGNEDNEPH